ncbi:CRISPR-associated endonuclease Cas2 [Fontivita pretiosa]|uniref:CRISPR-associated endonuclease Cas2 n=1 Tax=Fontivita pretiosa TaxID=2989684 RepID=UPI003D1765DC
MPRRQFLICYDIADDKRRNRVFETLLGNGDHAQYSVFFCELNPQELAQLRARLTQLINPREDQILILDLGDTQSPLENILDCLGKRYNPQTRVQIV